MLCPGRGEINLMIEIKRLCYGGRRIHGKNGCWLAFEAAQMRALEQTVISIWPTLKSVVMLVVVEATNKFDRLQVNAMADLELSKRRCWQRLRVYWQSSAQH